MEDYPPNPTGMPDEIYQLGVDLLTALVNTKDDSDTLVHIESALNSQGVDAALYLLYYGFMIKQTLNFSSHVSNEYQQQKDFRTLLQTAASIGAYASRERYAGIEKLDKIWNITEDDNV